MGGNVEGKWQGGKNVFYYNNWNYLSVITVLGLFSCTFKRQKSVNDDVVFSYARYMIYLLVAEVAIYVIFQLF